jgi:hypothetical protein
MTQETLGGEHAYADKRWDWDSLPRTGKEDNLVVPKGHYKKSVQAQIHPFWPSSCNHKHGAVQYLISATIKNVNQYGYLVTEHEVQEQVWVLNSTLPPKSLGLYESPRWSQTDWQDKTLRCTLSVPSGTVFLGQIVPVKVYMYKFLAGSIYDGRDVMVREARFSLIETRVLRGKNREETFTESCEIARVQAAEGWPEGKGSWSRHVDFQIPNSTALSTSMRTTYMDISHTLAMVLEVKGPKVKSSFFSKVPVLADSITMRTQGKHTCII